MAVRTTRKPSPGIKNLRVERASDNDGASVKASWGNPADALTDTNHRYECIDSRWTFKASRDMGKSEVQQRGSGHPTGDLVWVRDQGIHESVTVWYDRAKYHPRTMGRYLQSVTADVFAVNAAGKAHTVATMTLGTPRKPTISEPEYDGNGHVKCTINTDPGNDRLERWDTYWCIRRQDSFGTAYATEGLAKAWASSTDESIDAEIDVPSAQSLAPGEWVKVTFEAYARGLAGDSAHVTRTFWYGHPAQPSISEVVCDRLAGTGTVTVRIRTNATKERPIGAIRLYRYANTAIASAVTMSEVDISKWTAVPDAVDDGTCTGFSDAVAAALPSVGRRTWYRLESEYCGVHQYSEPFEAKCLYHTGDATGDDAVRFLALEPNDAKSVRAWVAWGDDDSTTTEVAWSAHSDAWESTEGPSTYDIAWEDRSLPEGFSLPSGFTHSASLYIRGLSEGEPVWVRARRKVDEGDVTRYGAWCLNENDAPVTPCVAPTGPVLSCPALVARGSDIPVSWSYDGGTQAAWQVLKVAGGTPELASGRDQSLSCVIPAAAYGDADVITLRLRLTAGGGWVDSADVSVRVEDAPSIAVAVAATVTAQPMSVSLATDSPRATAVVSVRAVGSVTDSPTGSSVQATGDVVWATSSLPEWAESDGAWRTTVTLPVSDLRDGASYEVAAVATDPSTGLSSGEASATFSVAWAHQATCPSPSSAVVPDRAAMACDVTPVAPEGAAATDVCDVYRLTADRAYLVAADVAFGSTVTDPYAPYASRGECAYRLCTRTADGDVDYADFPYSLRDDALRVDFGDEHVRLPYDRSVSDAFAKAFEARAHMDGEEAGYWNGNVTRTAALSSKLMLVDQSQARLLRRLGLHPGPCFVRTPSGCAYEANVNVGEIGDTFATGFVAVSLNASEVRLTGEFMAVPKGMGEVGDAS